MASIYHPSNGTNDNKSDCLTIFEDFGKPSLDPSFHLHVVDPFELHCDFGNLRYEKT